MHAKVHSYLHHCIIKLTLLLKVLYTVGLHSKEAAKRGDIYGFRGLSQ